MPRHTRHWTCESMSSPPMLGTKTSFESFSSARNASVECEPRLRFRGRSTRAHASAARDGAIDMDRLAPNCRSVFRPRGDMTRVAIAQPIRLQNRELLGSAKPKTTCAQTAIVLFMFACAFDSVAVPGYGPLPMFLASHMILLSDDGSYRPSVGRPGHSLRSSTGLTVAALA